MEQRVFLFQNVYVRLNAGSLTPMTESEVNLFCKSNRDVLIIHFKTGTEAAPAFFNHGPSRVKVINLTGSYQELFDSKDRELSTCFDTVLTWLNSIHPDGGFAKVIEQIRMR